VDTSSLEILVPAPGGILSALLLAAFLRIFPPYYIVLGLVFATLHRKQWAKDWAWYILARAIIGKLAKSSALSSAAGFACLTIPLSYSLSLASGDTSAEVSVVIIRQIDAKLRDVMNG
jgi:hypothetical protein